MKISLQESPVKVSMPPPKVVQGEDRSKVGGWRAEIDAFYETMQHFNNADMSEILGHLSSFSARMSAVRSQIVRSESRMMNNFRTKEIDPFLEECDRQYKIWSRQLTVLQNEWEMTKGI